MQVIFFVINHLKAMRLAMGSKRIFWFGMHKVLVQTELRRLRILGYEVFNPPYLSSIQDQSANLDWDNTQQSSLPKDVFAKLASYNFFYNEITAEIAEILNKYFDAVIVTISVRWLASVVKVYHKRIVFRTYGQHLSLCEEFSNEGLLFDVASRKNFFFVPHADEALRGEHSWLKERAIVVPYCLPDDIFEHTSEWSGHDVGVPGEIAMSCPNIGNAFFKAHYEFLKKNFSQDHYRFYGVQLGEIKDGQVVGTLSRTELIRRFKHAAGYLYSYTDARVCYLPPIEMMVLGGPVLFLKGSLLDSYFKDGAPGRCLDVEEAHLKSAQLLRRDQNFIDALLESQKIVVNRYHPEFVWPIFDDFFTRLFDIEMPRSAWLCKEPLDDGGIAKRIYLLHHFPGHPVVFDGMRYSAYDGIPRVMRQVVQALSGIQSVEIWITARYDQAEAFYGFFNFFDFDGADVKIMVVDDAEQQVDGEGESWLVKIKRVVKPIVPLKLRPLIVKALNIARHAFEAGKLIFFQDVTALNTDKLDYIKHINADQQCAFVIVPHYYCFPESLSLNKDIYLYLPDYMPHFFHKTGEFVGDEGVHTDIGRAVSQKARLVFCNSEFTKKYLPESKLVVDSEKIRVFFLPLLNSASVIVEAKGPPAPLRPYGYVFYPTQPRPNKNLSFLLRVFDALVQRGYDLNLVLTCGLDPDPKAHEVYRKMDNRGRVLFMTRISDDLLSLLYQYSATLCFTSLAEGNFPPQIQEAIIYNCPVVASHLDFITERIPEYLCDSLLLCQPNCLNSYIDACEFAINNRESVLSKQKKLYDFFLADENAHFQSDVRSIFFDKKNEN